MAATANPSATNLSPRYSPGDNLGSPKSRRPSGGVSSPPWTQIVRGEPEPVLSDPSSPSSPSAGPAAAGHEPAVALPDRLPPKDSCFSDDRVAENQYGGSENPNGDGNAGKKPAWNKPSNGAVEAGLVMGAVSWPALSEAARASAKCPSEAWKGPGDGSPTSQGTGVMPAAPSPQKQVNNNANPISSQNSLHFARQRSSKRSGGNLSATNGSTPAPVVPGAVLESPHGSPSPKDHGHKNNNWESGHKGLQLHSGHDHPQQQRNSFRRGNGGPHPRGDGSFHNNYGGRRDHDRGNHDWNPHRNYNGRDAQMQPPRGVVPRSFVRPVPHTSFIPPPTVRPFGNPMGFEMPSPMVYIPHETFRGVASVPFIAPIPPPAMIFPAMDHPLHAKIVTQIEYYFSNENLIKDVYLRQNMDNQGWVPIMLIAGFKKVKTLTDNKQLILDSLRTSTIVEVQGDKVRRRNDWKKWIMPSIEFPTVSGSQSLGTSTDDMLASGVQGLALGETANHSCVSGQVDISAEVLVTRLSSGDLYNEAQTSSSADIDQGAAQTGFDSFSSSRNPGEGESR